MMKVEKKMERFKNELEKQLKKFLEQYKTSYKIYEDEKGVLLALSLISKGDNDKFDTNVAYRFSLEDILQKDISYFIKVSKGLEEIKDALNSEVWKKYIPKE